MANFYLFSKSKKTRYRKATFSIIASSLLLLNTFFPTILAAQYVYAQETADTKVVEEIVVEDEIVEEECSKEDVEEASSTDEGEEASKEATETENVEAIEDPTEEIVETETDSVEVIEEEATEVNEEETEEAEDVTTEQAVEETTVESEVTREEPEEVEEEEALPNEETDGDTVLYRNLETYKEYKSTDGNFVLFFTKLENPGELTIEKIEFSEEEVQEFNLAIDYGYDVTSDMENGTFEYELEFKVDEADEANEVFAEEADKLDKLEVIEENRLDHFTVFTLEETGAEDNPLFPTKEECLEMPDGKMYICHATSSEVNPYNKLYLPCNAIYGHGQGGHLNENGTTASGHEDDVPVDEDGLCPGEEPGDDDEPEELGEKGECTEGTLFRIGDVESDPMDNPADEFNWPGGFGIFPEFTDPFLVGTTPTSEFPWNSNYNKDYALDFDVLFTYIGDAPEEAQLIVSWSPGKSATERKEVFYNGDSLGTAERVGVSTSGWWENMPVYQDTFDIDLEAGTHEINLKHLTGDGTLWDYVELEITQCDKEDECEDGPTWADYVVSAEQGDRKDGGDISEDRSDPESTLGEPDGVFYSLGLGGVLVVEFENDVMDVDGDDLSFHEVTNGRDGYPEEIIKVEVSQDGENWYEIGEVTNHETDGIGYLDFSSTPLSWVKYVRITDVSDPDIQKSNGDGYDLDAVDATYGSCEEHDPDEPETGTIEICKFEDTNINGKMDEEEEIISWDVYVEELGEGLLNKRDCYEWSNVETGDYTVYEATVEGWEMTTDNNYDVIEVEEDETTTVYFGNYEYGSISGYKWSDENNNGEWDGLIREQTDQEKTSLLETEPALADWVIFIDENENEELDEGETWTTTDEKGYYIFEGLPEGEYSICEVVGDDWVQTYPIKANCHTVFIEESGQESSERNFGNYYEIPTLEITKENDTDPTITTSGATVTFTLYVEAFANNVYGVSVLDLPPEGFVYVPGSWTANSSTRGDLVLLGVTTEPTYASPGEWDLGDMEIGEIVTLTYQAKISDAQDPGTYKDLAWASGENAIGGELLADAGLLGYVDENYVGTQVTIDENPEPNEAEADVEVNEIIEESEVLGAATSRLPATGSPNKLMILAATLLIAGIGAIMLGKRKNIKSIRVLLVFAVVATFFAGSAYAGSLVVRVETPDAETNAPFELGFVTMDLDGNVPTVKCFVKKPNEASFVQFDTDKVLNAGGDSGSCAVSSSVLNTDGTYKFKVTSETTSETVESDVVSAVYDTSKPDAPKYIQKDKKNSCKYEVELKTGINGNTAYVEIYRSKDKEFYANDATRIRTITIGPNEKYEFTDELSGDDCGNNYYAARAFDAAGNPSGVVVEEIDEVKVVTIEGDTETTTEGSGGTGAIPTGGSILGDFVANLQGDETGDAEVVLEEPYETPEVLGTEDEIPLTDGNTDGTDGGFEIGTFPILLILLALVVGGLTYGYSKRSR